MSKKVDFTDVKDLEENSSSDMSIIWLTVIYGPAVIVLIVSIWNFLLSD